MYYYYCMHYCKLLLFLLDLRTAGSIDIEDKTKALIPRPPTHGEFRRSINNISNSNSTESTKSPNNTDS